MEKNNSEIKGKGRINTKNVNSKNECIVLSYPLTGIRDNEQAKTLANKIIEILPDDTDVKFSLSYSDWRGDSEKIALSVSIKACSSHKKAHVLKKEIDEYISRIGGQTTLDEVTN